LIANDKHARRQGELSMKLRNLFATLLTLGVVIGSVQARAWSGQPSEPVFVVTGMVNTPKTVYVRDLLMLPRAQENITYFAAGSVVSQSFSGVLLWDLLQSVGIVVNPNIKNDILRKTIVGTGSDGYESVFTAGEIAPNFGGNQIMVAYLVDGQLLGTQGPMRIVVPSDKQGGRFVSMIVTIEVRDGG
jgi:DMSO/TMAO reductase YedYZ molybdopterin-dependent catalytic subunit